MTTKVVIRAVDGSGHLLGWTECLAVARGDGCLRAPAPVAVPIDAAGTVTAISIHWADVHVEARSPVLPTALEPGDTLTPFQKGDPLIVVGPIPGPLPPVTTRSRVAVAMPVAAIGARG